MYSPKNDYDRVEIYGRRQDENEVSLRMCKSLERINKKRMGNGPRV